MFTYLKLIMLFSLFTTNTNSNAQDWANLERYRQANAQLPMRAKNEQRVVLMGNSITDTWATKFPGFFKKNNYVGRGISGQTTPQMLMRF